MTDLIYSITFGAVQGITEFLPVSSTGHLILTSRILNFGQTDFFKSFEIIIQLGSILAIVVLYWRELFTEWKIIKRVIVAFIPTGILGLILYKIAKQYLLNNYTAVLWTLFLGGAMLIIFELWYSKTNRPQEQKEDIRDIPYKSCLCIGLFQSIAIFPGISRSAATILGGLLLRLTRKTIVEFSFILAVPTMLAATGLDLFKNASLFSFSQWNFLIVGFIVSFIVALASVKFLIGFIKRHSFLAFGVYRMIIAGLFWFFILK